MGDGTGEEFGHSVWVQPLSPMISLRHLSWLAVAALATGCASTPPSPPRLAMPSVYQIKLPAAAPAGATPDSTKELTQAVRVPPHELLYYRVDSPVDVTVSVFEVRRDATRTLLGQMRGTSFTTSVMPTTPDVEFAFTPAPAKGEGAVHFAVANAPITASAQARVAAVSE